MDSKNISAEEMLKKHDVSIDRWPDTKVCIIAAMEEYKLLNNNNNGWISCSDRLPEGGTDVIVCKNNMVVAPMRYFNYKFQYKQGTFKYLDQTSQVTHWLPLPSPPIQQPKI